MRSSQKLWQSQDKKEHNHKARQQLNYLGSKNEYWRADINNEVVVPKADDAPKEESLTTTSLHTLTVYISRIALFCHFRLYTSRVRRAFQLDWLWICFV